MERPVDAVTAAVLKLQMTQRAVNAHLGEVIKRVSADPFGESSQPALRIRLLELRISVDQAADELIDALARMGEATTTSDST